MNAQWTLQTNPLGTTNGNSLGKIQFVSPVEGWIAVSANGSLLHTTDGGANWSIVNPFPDDLVGNMSDPALSMSWVNATHGWAIKTYGDKTENMAAANGATIYKTADGGVTWNKTDLPKLFTPVTYTSADLDGHWYIHALTADNPGDATNNSTWYYGDATIDSSLPTITFNAIYPGGVTESQTGTTPIITAEGVVKFVDGGDMEGFMSADKKSVYMTFTEKNDDKTLMVWQKDMSTAYNIADLEGIWQFHSLETGTDGNWSHGTITYDNAGNGTINGESNGGNSFSTDLVSQLSMTGIFTTTGFDDMNGFMSADKQTLTFTMSSASGKYSIFLMQKQAETVYDQLDLAGLWKINSLITDNPNDSQPFSAWMSGDAAIDANGNTELSNVVMNGQIQTDNISTSIMLDGSGFLSGFGNDDSHGFLSADKSIGFITGTDGSGGYSLYIIQRDLTKTGDFGLQIQFADENTGWASVYNMSHSSFKLYKTTNGGTDWNEITGESNQIGGIYHFVDADNGWLIGADGTLNGEELSDIFHTTDGGLSWTLQDNGGSGIGAANSIYFSDLLHGWVVGKDGLIMNTEDGGESWNTLDPGDTGQNSSANFKTVFFLDADHGWFGSEKSPDTEGVGTRFVVETKDGGATWSTQQTPVTNSIFSISFWDENNGWFTSDYGQIAHYTPPSTVDITAGNLSSILTTEQLNTTKNLKLTGTIDARDFKTMRDNMPLLSYLDLSEVTVVEYEGTEGTESTASIFYPENTVPQKAFYLSAGKPGLTTAILPNTLTYIGNNAFNNCSGLASVVIPDDVTQIDSLAFYKCTQLASISLPQNLETIGMSAFGFCEKLTQINIPANVSSIGTVAFTGTKAQIVVDEYNPYYLSEEGLLFDIDKTVLMYCPNTKNGGYNIPSSVNTIDVDAFDGCSGLIIINIPPTVTTLKDKAFENCTNLNSIIIPPSVNFIGSGVFYNCSNLNNIITLNFTPIDLSGSPDVFYNVNKNTCMLNVPPGSLDAYKGANQWQDFLNIMENGTSSYNNGTLGGAWYTVLSGEQDTYFLFDGNGNINEMGAYYDHSVSNIGTYTVSSDGTVSMNFTIGTQNISAGGQFMNTDSIAVSSPMTGYMVRIPNTGVLNGAWNGSVTNSAFSNFNISLDYGGYISNSSNWRGHIFTRNGKTVGFISTYAGNCWNGIRLSNTTFDGINTITGTAISECSDTQGTITLVRPTLYSYSQVTPRPYYIIGLGDGFWNNSPSGLGVSYWPMSLVEGNNYDNNGNGLFTYTGYFSASREFKLIGSSLDWTDEWGNGGSTGINNLIHNVPGSNNLKVPFDGYFTLTLNSISNTLSINPMPPMPTLYSTMSMIGDMSNWTTDIPMTPVESSNNHVWYTDYTFTSNQTLGVKFRSNNVWDRNWGNSSFPNGIGIQEGANIPYMAGTYKIFLNDLDGTYYFISRVPTGTKNTESGELIIYPNPVTDGFYLNISDKNAQVSIYDVRGALLMTRQLSGNEYINAGSLKQGVYLVKVKTENGLITKKLVKK